MADRYIVFDIRNYSESELQDELNRLDAEGYDFISFIDTRNRYGSQLIIMKKKIDFNLSSYCTRVQTEEG